MSLNQANWSGNILKMVTFMIVALGLGFFTIIGSSAMQQASALDQSHMLWTTTRSANVLRDLAKSVLDSGDTIIFHYSSTGAPTSTQITALKAVTNVPNSHKGFEFFSLAAIKKYAPVAKENGFGFIAYDLEDGSSPSSEVSNPVTSFKNAASIAHSYGLKLIATPGYPILTNYATQFARYVDGVHMQTQRLQNDDLDCKTMKNFVVSMVSKLESAKSSLAGHIVYQTTFSRFTAGDKTIYNTQKDCIDAVSPTSVDGLFIWWTGASYDSGDYQKLLKYHESKYS